MQKEEGRNVSFKRLFILGGVDTSADDFRDHFSTFGTVEDVKKIIKRDGQDKGLVYITFSKTSEAALALDKMNGSQMPGKDRRLKVVFAQDHNSDNAEPDPCLDRIFVKVPDELSREDVTKIFSEYGTVTKVNVLQNSATQSSRGLAFVTFDSPYYAALAVENSPDEYKAVFAQARSDSGSSRRDRGRDSGSYGRDRGRNYSRDRGSDGRDRGSDYSRDRGDYSRDRGGYGRDRGDYQYESMDYSRDRSFSGDRSGYENRYDSRATNRYESESVRFDPRSLGESHTERCSCVLEAHMPFQMMPEIASAFFGLMPGLEYCTPLPNDSFTVKYQNSGYAAYAKEKLNGYQYLPKAYITVKESFPEELSSVTQSLQSTVNSGNLDHNQLSTLVNTMQSAQKLLAQYSGGSQDTVRVSYVNIELPQRKPLADIDAPVEMRLFLVFNPCHPSEDMLVDCFCRFGNLIHVNLIPGKKVGYARYASKDSAEHAMRVLHQQYIDNIHMKVLEAEPPRNGDESMAKRQRLY